MVSQKGTFYKELRDAQWRRSQRHKCCLLYADHSVSTWDRHWGEMTANMDTEDTVGEDRKNTVKLRKQRSFPKELNEAAEPPMNIKMVNFREKKGIPKNIRITVKIEV